jgi:hypothetical protein
MMKLPTLKSDAIHEYFQRIKYLKTYASVLRNEDSIKPRKLNLSGLAVQVSEVIKSSVLNKQIPSSLKETTNFVLPSKYPFAHL